MDNFQNFLMRIAKERFGAAEPVNSKERGIMEITLWTDTY